MIKAVYGSTWTSARDPPRYSPSPASSSRANDPVTLNLLDTSRHSYRATLPESPFKFPHLLPRNLTRARNTIRYLVRVRDFIRGSRVSGANDRGSRQIGSAIFASSEEIPSDTHNFFRYRIASASFSTRASSERKSGNIIQIVSIERTTWAKTCVCVFVRAGAGGQVRGRGARSGEWN